MLRKVSLIAALVAAIAIPSVAMARGGMGGHGGMGMGHGVGMAHAGSVGHFGAANVGGGAWRGGTFRSAAFPARHAFFPGRRAFFRHHFRHRHFFVGGLGVGYAYDNSCYQPVLTQWSWRWQWVCGYDY